MPIKIIFQHECTAATITPSPSISLAYTVFVDALKEYTDIFFTISEPSGISCMEFNLTDSSSPPNQYTNPIISLKPSFLPPTIVVGPTSEGHIGNI